ncbi:S1C family serine protease [Reinekea marinisedimentorum]|uniref:Serine protease DegS/serine protease DegQ n=1 Tax=Reinekea marinisedimentorum TaxID=230495 RepID=A0A4R3HXR0_9GAMM|nr:trypsin-like peptidase domain-containing protein [Reinekea marinisedimentorum]TCS37634.1 serine protease DegS/serine protease DegQ [Reinekea marinisedimentorum]
MKKKPFTVDWLRALSAGLILGLVLVVANQQLNNRGPNTATGYADTLAPVLPYTVSIYTNQTINLGQSPLDDDPFFSQYVQPGSYQKTSLGSGIILDTEGHIVTNAHVVEGAQQIIVVASDGAQAEVRRTFIDPDTDIAVLQTGLTISTPLRTASIESIRVGDLAFTIGNPFGIGQSVSMGIISATARMQPNLTRLTDFIQTDAAINPGNSGGALVNAQGEVIGMNTAIYSSNGGSQGIGFAIPIGHVQKVAGTLLENGMVSRGYLGIDVRELSATELKESNQGSAEGIIVISVAPDSPAEQAGILAGDVLLSLNGQPLSNRTQVARLIAQLIPEQPETLEVSRKGERLAITVTPGYRQ